MAARTLVLILSLALSLSALQREPLSEYQARRQRLAQQIKGSVLVLEAAPEVDLVEYQQEDNFYYLTGFDQPEATFVLDARSDEPQEYLFLPPRNPAEERWTGAKLGPGPDGARATGFANVLSTDDLNATLQRVAPNSESILRLNDAAARIAQLRQVKSPSEIGLIEKAVEITLKGHTAAAGAIRPGAPEYEVEAALEYEFRRSGAARPGFPSIVGSGPFSTILHYDRSTRTMQAGDLVVVDVGAEYGGYSADVTRTYPVSGKFSERQREIYQIVLDAQKAAIARVKPGVRLREIHQAAMDVIRAKGFDRYFIHGTSHHIGLHVHDVGDPNRPLEANMTLTVEPGIYIESEQLGVRIEDDLVVTPDGYRMLSEFPKEVEEIENLMARERSQP